MTPFVSNNEVTKFSSYIQVHTVVASWQRMGKNQWTHHIACR